MAQPQISSTRRNSGDGKIHVEAGDGLEFVERAAGVAEAAAADHRHRDARGGRQRSEHQRSLVAHAAGGMLVDFSCGQRREVEHFAGAQHRVGQAAVSGRVMPFSTTAISHAET